VETHPDGLHRQAQRSHPANENGNRKCKKMEIEKPDGASKPDGINNAKT
jgi:hypothetical protein